MAGYYEKQEHTSTCVCVLCIGINNFVTLTPQDTVRGSVRLFCYAENEL